MQVACIEDLCAHEAPIKQIRRAGTMPRLDISLLALLSAKPNMRKQYKQRRNYSDKTIIQRLEQLPNSFNTNDIMAIFGMRNDAAQRFANEAHDLGKIIISKRNSSLGPRQYKKVGA